MTEKTMLLPTADNRYAPLPPPPYADEASLGQDLDPQTRFRIIIVPGLDFVPGRRYRYGCHALLAGILILVSYILIEMRDCNWSPGIELDKLQIIHVTLASLALFLYVLSLFGIADFIFSFGVFFFVGVLLVYGIAVCMIWMSYEAAVNPCMKTFRSLPIDMSLPIETKNVFTRGDGIGIVVLLVDIFATFLMISAATNFYKRY